MTPQELKDSIILRAIQGKLVEQRTEEESGIELYNRIQAEKKEQQKKGLIKKEDTYCDITDDSKSFDIPENWTWVRLEEITTESILNDGNWVLSKDMDPSGTVKLIQLGNIGNCSYIEKGYKYLNYTHFKELNGRQVFPGYILVNRLIGDKMLSCIIPNIDGILMTAVDVCWIAPNDSWYNTKYLMYALSSSDFQTKVKALGRGTTRFRISKTNLVDIPFPMPPLDEQKRIVAKIEELLPYVDHYEKAWTKLEDFNKRFPVDMQKSVLQMAIQGKLVEQRAEEGTGEELYKKIQAEKQKLIKEGKIKKDKPLPAITDEEKPFDIPDSWIWVRFQDLCAVLTCGYASTPTYVSAEKGMPFISAKNVKPYHFMPEEHKYISKELYKQLTNTCKPEKEDILLTRVGAGIGEAAIIDVDFDFAIYVSLTLIKLVDIKLIDNKYILYWLNSPIGVTVAKKNIYGKGASQGNLNVKKVREYLIPLPPLEEQKRIVIKLEEILLLCEKLK